MRGSWDTYPGTSSALSGGPSFQPLQILVGVAFALTIAPAVRMLR